MLSSRPGTKTIFLGVPPTNFATVAFDAGAFADSRRRVADFFGYYLKGK